ncbi:mandelate racemase/muconate lactonizing enzyme family protein [Micromonospora sp. CPCC 206061]|uniref:mandelate racemase/muconate lactonizing enzyme family protein n=1 Tax=Micromonospora sp. CPCC 206061 TaxID=3122410 RepID=UPI002FF09B92
MKIIGLETVRLPHLPNLLYVHVSTDTGLVGLGETYYGAGAAEAVVHEELAPRLLGLALGDSARDIARHAGGTAAYVGYSGSGAETRARSAVDLALWDIAAQHAGVPLADLLGRRRDSLRVYNTCAGPLYMRQTFGQVSSNWGLTAADGRSQRYEDLDAFLHRPEQLARDLLAQGITAMKIWPFDQLAEQTSGRSIDAAGLAAGCEPLRRIRAEVGDAIDIAVELHALWDLDPARRILDAIAEFAPFWAEDALRPDDLKGLRTLRAGSPIPLAGGETLGGARAHRNLLDADGIDVPIVDLGWVGGISEALDLIPAAQAAGRPLTLHDCSGPVVFAASVHLAMHLPDNPIQEFTRSYYHGWWRDIVDGIPPVRIGTVAPAVLSGHGISLRRDVLAAPSTRIRRQGRCLTAPSRSSVTDDGPPQPSAATANAG